jgi:diguanylate cyclase (GGDEF)-like protein
MAERVDGWLAPGQADRERLAEMQDTVELGLLAGVQLTAGAAVAAISGGPAWLLVAVAAGACALAGRARGTGARAGGVTAAFAALLLVVAWLAGVAAVSGGPGSPLLVWGLLGVVVGIAGLSRRAHAVMCAWTAVCVLGAAGTDAGMVVDDPAAVGAVLVLLGVLALLGARLIGRDVQQRTAAWRDPLTGALNRAALERRHDSLRAGQGASLIVFDLDRFKEINDLRGHPFGDRALRQAALAAAGVVRDHDCVFRLGGEEFAILLAGAGHTEALRVAERARAAIRAAHIDGVVVTASFGVATALADRVPASLPELYEQADRAMYRAKQAGRDRVHAAWATQEAL